MRRLLPVLVALVFAVPAAGAPSAKLAAVTLDGVGGVVPGMTVAQIEQQWGTTLQPVGRTCGFVPFAVGDVRGRALFSGGKLGALFFDQGATTLSGIGIGTKLSVLVKRFGTKLKTEPGSQFLFLVRHDKPHWQIRFDLDLVTNTVERIGFGENWYVHVLAGCG
jgi:hypothetical protein